MIFKYFFYQLCKIIKHPREKERERVLHYNSRLFSETLVVFGQRTMVYSVAMDCFNENLVLNFLRGTDDRF